jgi:hypothetical protein
VRIRPSASPYGAILALVAALSAVVLPEAARPISADGPGTSFSIDLDPGQAGTQATRSVAVGTPFSLALVLDATDVAQYFEIDAYIIYDDVRLTAPASGIPADWAALPQPGPIGGRTAPWTGDFECSPAGAGALLMEDNIGTAAFNMACYSTQQPEVIPLSYTGSVFEVVLRCDSVGSADITVSSDVSYNFILDLGLNGHNDHQHNATVNCTPGGGDADGDGMPDVYESQYTCLSVNTADATADPDGDNYTNITEYQIGTNPCDLDTDNDGCADSEEAPTNPPTLGGQRDPQNGYDFYDVNASRTINSVDIGSVRANFNGNGPTPLEDLVYDRSLGAAIWAPGPPDNRINAVDIGLVRASFNNSCLAPPN